MFVIVEGITDSPVFPPIDLLPPALRPALSVFAGRQIFETKKKHFVFEGMDSMQSYT